MVKTPRTRHSKTERDPMTIELGPDEVSRVATEGEASSTDAEPMGAEPSAEGVKEDVGASAAAAESPLGASAAESEAEPRESNPAFEEAPKPAESQAARDDATEQKRPSFAGAEPQVAPAPVSRGSTLAAGLAGGLIALVCGGLLQFAGVLGTPGGSTAPASVETEIAALRSEIEGLKAGAGNAGEVSGRVDGLSQALDQVKTDIASLRQAVESGSAGPGLQTLNAKIAEIETRMTEIGPGPDGATPEEVAALNEKIAGVEALAKAATEAGSTVTSRLGVLEQSLSALSAKVDSQAQQPKVALAIAASALKAAIERGSPFEPELETLAAVAPQASGLAELRAYAERGIAARADIIAETDAAANAMIEAANPPSENADFFERLLDSAESLVEVRPIGAVEGPGVPETVARMEVALQAGDLAKAIAEFETLPEPAKAAGAAFADRIRARLAVEQLADQAIAGAMQAP
jgi:hypothetical protein